MAKKENSSIFPNNVVDRILRSLTAEEDLLVCRKVDPTWVSIVNQLPPLHSWNPWLARADNDALITFLATIFLFKSDIEKFLSSHQQYDPKNNPFLNRTVVLGFRKGAWDSFTEYFAFQLIANKFGAHLQKFVYRPDVDEDLSESPWRHLPQMLTSMPNLRSLVLEHRNKITTYVKWKSIPVPDFPHKLEQLQELLIKASYQYQSNIRLCEKLAVNHGSQIRSLELSPFVLDNEKRNLLNLFPNLKEFKSLDFEVLKSANLTACNWPKLEGLALLVYTLEDSRAFRDTLNFVKNFAQTLKVLSLGLEELDESEEIEPPEWESVNSGLKLGTARCSHLLI
ncbi:hypothetical protein Ocin01_15831 [Orchesella cincta]|uniref:F-box domain-containing protein n=1 Tax=Orchesella cincta TaxID=48709 RepID=A0A1D2MD85_ORCCI|nr:hypothetical protein Ocin01_15831 [Orchesella cincta]